MGRPVPCRDRTGALIFRSPSRHPHKFTVSCALPLLLPFGLPSPHLAPGRCPFRLEDCDGVCGNLCQAAQRLSVPPSMPAVPGFPACAHSTLKESAPCLAPPCPSVLWSLSPSFRSHWRTCSLSCSCMGFYCSIAISPQLDAPDHAVAFYRCRGLQPSTCPSGPKAAARCC